MNPSRLLRHKRNSVLLVVCAMLAVMGVVVLDGGFRAQADANVYTLSPDDLEAAAHELGYHLHDVAADDTPVVIDFGGAPADAPIAGLDQWLAHQQGELQAASLSGTPITGVKKVVVLRVYFRDRAANSTFSQADVQNLFDRLDQLWQDTSYGKISIDHEVSTLYQLPDNRSAYIDDGDGWIDVNGDGDYDPGVDNPDGDGDGTEGTPCDVTSSGDLSCGDKYQKVLDDAVANAPSSGANKVDFSGADAVFVLMAETDNSQFHRGQANKCTLPIGNNGANRTVGCGIFSENPGENADRRWGRWAHEMGHAFQEGGPAHPSNYNSSFELMDNLLPGQTGVFEKQDHVGFPGWLPPSKYVEISSANGGEEICLWAEEYKPGDKPNPQAIKANITGSLYYMISVRRRVNGDEISPIPDQGVLIERVSEGANPWVTVQGRGGNRNVLWKSGDTYDGGADGVQIIIGKQLDDDNYCVTVRYDKRANQPDVMIAPWTSAPGNTWETTDIWVDSPVNGYGTYRLGMWDDLRGGMVPRGNGDNPAVGMVNRLYARVRNVGTAPATDVKVNFEITNPPGVGIAGANGWAPVGSVDKNDFPALANIPPGGTVDVYVEWTPNFSLTDEQIAQGIFYFHTCVRVKIDQVTGETVLGNQDGDREQENIDFFQAVTNGSAPSVYDKFIVLRNDDLTKPKFFYLSYETDVPDPWIVNINGGKQGVWVDPNDTVKIPVVIKPQGQAVVGSTFGVDVRASYLDFLVNDLDPKDTHPVDMELGGARVETWVLEQPEIKCEASDFGEIVVKGQLMSQNFEKFYDPKNPFPVLIQGVDGKRRFISDAQQVVQVNRDGSFEGAIYSQKSRIVEVVCLFAGTKELASAGSGYVRVPNSQSPLPTPTATRKPRPTRTPTPTATRIPNATDTPTPTPTPQFNFLPVGPVVLVDRPSILNADLGIHGIEITQGIQCFDTSKGLADCPDNSLPVVAGKLTAARVYLSYSHIFLSQRSNVPVRLYMSVDGGPWMTANATAKALSVLDQSSADNSANFIFTIPGPAASVVRFYAVVDPDNVLTETNEGNNRYPSSGYVTMTFRPRQDLKIIGRPLDYHPAGYTGTRQAQGWAVNGGAATWFNQLLPIEDNGIDYSVASSFKDWTTSLGSSAGQHALIENLNGEYALLVIFGVLFGNTSIIPDHIYGWAPNDGYSGGHADMPVYPHAGGLGVVGIGSDRPGTSTDNPGGGALIFGHELTHDYDIKHTDTADSCGSSDSSSPFPYSSSSIQEFGFNPATLKVYDPATTHDLMSYCPASGSKEGWISPYTWEQMFNNLASSAANAAEAAGAEGDVIAARPGFFTLYRTAHAKSVIVNSTIKNPDVNNGQPGGSLKDLYLVDNGFSLVLPDGNYAIELRGNGQVLATQTFKVDFTSEYHKDGPGHAHGAEAGQEEDPFFKDPNPTSEVDITLVVPWVDGTDTIALVLQEGGKTVQTLDERKVTGNPPAVQITSPVEETVWKAGATEKITWDASDKDGDTLSYAVFYSADAGQTWQLLAKDLTEPAYTVNVDSLAGGVDVRFRVVASDGVNTGVAETPQAIEVPDKAPNPVILEPGPNRSFVPGQTVVLRGSASDLEDGTIPSSNLRWLSDKQGELGVGPTVATQDLQPGKHTITLEAQDSAGNTGQTTVEVLVGYNTYLPSVERPSQ